MSKNKLWIQIKLTWKGTITLNLSFLLKAGIVSLLKYFIEVHIDWLLYLKVVYSTKVNKYWFDLKWVVSKLCL